MTYPVTALPFLRTGLMAALCAVFLILPSAELASQNQPALPPGMDLWEGDPGALPDWSLERSPPKLVARAKRHREFLQAGVPLEYRSVSDPYPATSGAIRDGGLIYAVRCASCHGIDGRGDGDAGMDLLPSPALLARLMEQQGAVDEYMLWTISEGGPPFGTAMPAFKGDLSEREIWQVVTFMRAGFPSDKVAPQAN